eukprot:4982123-Amphidinium_carterae.1
MHCIEHNECARPHRAQPSGEDGMLQIIPGSMKRVSVPGCKDVKTAAHPQQRAAVDGVLVAMEVD